MAEVTVKLVETPQEYEAVRAVRLRVFIEEQGIDPALEYDELDPTATHAIAFVNGAPSVTGRMVPDEPGVARIGRMAVDAAWRRHGVGSRLLRALEAEAARQGYHTALLHAQTYVQAFYQTLGYRPVGEPFMEAGIEHITMTRPLST